MADVADLSTVQIGEDFDYSDTENEHVLKYDSLYERAYGLYQEAKNGELFEDDADLVSNMIKSIGLYLSELKSDYSVDQEDRDTEFSDENLKHYRKHFNNLKKGLEEELAKLSGGEVGERSNAKQTEAIHAQISALKAMREQLDEQIAALTKAL